MDWVKIGIYIIGFIIVLSMLQFLLSIHPFKFTSKKTPADYNLDYEKVEFKTSDDITIRGWLVASKKANGTVIIGHGYPFDKSNIMPLVTFLHPDYNLLLYDHRYFGESEGRITSVGIREVKDVEAAVKFVKKKFGKKPVGLYGFSLSASTMLMAQPDVNVIIAEAPYADLERIINSVYRMFGPLRWPFVKITDFLVWIVFGVDPKNVSAVDAVKESKIPTFLIHGDKDIQIPVEHSYAIKESNPKIELWIIKGADHGEAHMLKEKEYEKKVKDFLKKHMK